MCSQRIPGSVTKDGRKRITDIRQTSSCLCCQDLIIKLVDWTSEQVCDLEWVLSVLWFLFSSLKLCLTHWVVKRIKALIYVMYLEKRLAHSKHYIGMCCIPLTQVWQEARGKVAAKTNLKIRFKLSSLASSYNYYLSFKIMKLCNCRRKYKI